MAKITYEDKVALIENADIPDINKITDDDMNEIKSVVNENAINISNEVDEDYRVNLSKTKNLFNKNIGILSGFYYNDTTGVKTATATANNYIQETYIKVKPSTDYTLSATTGSQFLRIVEYDESLNFIRTTNSGSGVNTETITTTSNTRYVRISANGENVLDTLQLEEGSSATTYEAFVPNQIVVDNEKYTDTLNVGSVIDSRNRVNVLKSNNLFDYTSSVKRNSNATPSLITNGIKITPSQANGWSLWIIKDVSNYVGKKFTMKSTFSGGKIAFALVDSNGYNITNLVDTTSSDTDLTCTIPTLSNATYLAIQLFGSTTGTSAVDYTNIEVEEGEQTTGYLPYKYASINVDEETIYQRPVVLWENNSPSSAFANQTITLASDNYDYFDLYYKQGTSSSMVMCTRVLKGYGTRVILSSVNSSYAGGLVYQRTLTRTNDTTYTLGDCSKQSGTTVETDNASIIPIQIIGYK